MATPCRARRLRHRDRALPTVGGLTASRFCAGVTALRIGYVRRADNSSRSPRRSAVASYVETPRVDLLGGHNSEVWRSCGFWHDLPEDDAGAAAAGILHWEDRRGDTVAKGRNRRETTWRRRCPRRVARRERYGASRHRREVSQRPGGLRRQSVGTCEHGS